MMCSKFQAFALLSIALLAIMPAHSANELNRLVDQLCQALGEPTAITTCRQEALSTIEAGQLEPVLPEWDADRCTALTDPQQQHRCHAELSRDFAIASGELKRCQSIPLADIQLDCRKAIIINQIRSLHAAKTTHAGAAVQPKTTQAASQIAPARTPATTRKPATALDNQLRLLIDQHQLDQPFQPDMIPTSDALVELGGRLFFSPDLSIDGSVSCASCHHPDHAGTDGIALPIGIGGVDSRHIGEDRIKAAREADPDQTLLGLVPRNAPSVINAALYRQAIFWDGRVHYRPDPEQPDQKKIVAGFGPAQFNPSNYLQENLLQTQARMPLTSSFEMKGGLAPNRNAHEIEQDILHFLQTQSDWCLAFAGVWGVEPCAELITLNNLTRALASFQASLIKTDSPFERYIQGERSALDDEQKRGALLFLAEKTNGGVGCAACHAGKTFSSEKFYNINIPPSGKGANDLGWDLGRHNVDKTAERFSFRVPILLNVAHTGPYFHNGIAATLEDAIRFKQTDPTAKRPAQPIHLPGIDYAPIEQAISQAFATSAAKPLLPERLSDDQIQALAAFLRSLSDPCLDDTACRKRMAHDIVVSPRERRAERTRRLTPPRQRTRQLTQPRQLTQLNQPNLRCASWSVKPAPDTPSFSRHSLEVGLAHERQIGLVKKGWLMDVVNYASVSATDLNHDCLDDLVFDAGLGQVKVYTQQPEGRFITRKHAYKPKPGAVNALVLDLDGDYRPDLFMGNYGQQSAEFAFDFLNTSNDVIPLQDLTGPVISMTPGDLNADGYLDVVFAMWRSFNSLKQPHIWFNDGQGNLRAEQGFGFINLRQHERNLGGDEQVRRIAHLNLGESDLTFTPNLLDINEDGQTDMLLAADFFRSQVLINQNGKLQDVTDKSVINDNNGMGAAVGDFNGDGLFDWFVSSITDNVDLRNSAGHKLYLNQGDGQFMQAPIVNKDVEWSWGSCTADFNNDGHLDIFYISGYGEHMPTAHYESEPQKEASLTFLEHLRKYADTRPTLLINNGNGQFSDQSQQYGLTTDSLDGRGIACFDYQQDGDIDVVVAPLEGRPVLLRNNQQGRSNWLALRFIGMPGNTEAFGTQVTLHTRQGKQIREVHFANNFVSRNPAQLHFGLGSIDSVERIDIRLPAPHQRVVTLDALAINQLHILRIADLLDQASESPLSSR